MSNTITSQNGAQTGALTKPEARELTQQIRASIEATWKLVVKAYMQRAWAAMGYESWDRYVLAEFGQYALTVPREDRPEMVRSMKMLGMSNRSIGEAAGIGESQVRRDLKEAELRQNGAPHEADAELNAIAEELEITVVPDYVLGKDGKRQPATWVKVEEAEQEKQQPAQIVVDRGQDQPTEKPHPHQVATSEAVQTAKVAAQEARRTARVLLSYMKQPHIRAGLNKNDRAALLRSIEAADKFLSESLELLTA